ncbi:hypothetical protein [Actinomadura napierensis]|uniref:DUF5709 domain-containing protein n=1 Tax=Actinomadura napierensis TaxID=267854 RepID=A0ABN2Y062_9ACTN
MNEQDRYRGQDPDDLYSSREEDEYATGDEMSSSMGSSQSGGTDEPEMRQEQGGQGYGQGPQGYQDEPGFEGGGGQGHGQDHDDHSSDMGGMQGRDAPSRRRSQDDDDLYGDQLDDMHRDEETDENF